MIRLSMSGESVSKTRDIGEIETCSMLFRGPSFSLVLFADGEAECDAIEDWYGRSVRVTVETVD